MLGITVVDRYIVRQVLKPLVTAMIIGLSVLMAERMVHLLDVALGKKNSLSVVFQLLAYLVPGYLGLAIPTAMFIGLLFGFNKLSKDAEIDAFMAAGIGINRLARPVGYMAVVLGLISLLIFGWFQPQTLYTYRSVLFAVKNVEAFDPAEEGVFMQAGSRTFILDKLSRAHNSFERIFLFDNRGVDGTETVTARSGALIDQPSDPRPVLRLDDGNRLNLNAWPQFTAGAEPPKAVVGSFKTVDTPLGRISNKVFRPRGNDGTRAHLQRTLQHPRRLPHRGAVQRRALGVPQARGVRPDGAHPPDAGVAVRSRPHRRGYRAYRFAIALAILVGYHEVLDQGALASRLNGTSPYLTLWLPFALLVAFSAWRYYNTCFRLRPDRLEPLVERLSDVVRAIRHRIAGQLGWSRS